MALATVADLVPLIGENRRLVRQGLAAMRASPRPGLRALMAVARVEPETVDEQAPRASGWRPGSTPPGASTAPTPASS